jgi:flagellar basal-body rod modification protein FlgD
MEINPAGIAGAAAKSKTEENANAAAVAGDFETFLTLLTSQMKNQDPLKPMESTEFVAQLASFSAVEQQVRTNDRLDDIFGALSGGSSAGMAEWIGREVRAPVKADFSGAPVEVAVAAEATADKAVLVVRNDFDQVVARRAFDPAATNVSWNGLDDSGTAAAHGRYGFSVESWAGETLLGTALGSVYAEVNEVRVVDGAPVLVVAGGAQVPLGEVDGLR